jgi:hypothetical protein
MNVGLDIHGVIDTYPIIFKELSEQLMDRGHDVHIVTGRPQNECEDHIKELGIKYNHFFSIVDYHKQIHESTIKEHNGHVWMDDDIWVRTKGEYASIAGLDLHFDDSKEYLPYFPDSCSTVLVRDNFPEWIKIFVEMGSLSGL